MHDKSLISQEIKVSMIIPLAYSMLAFFWLAWYAVFDGADFDETLTTNGVDGFNELDSMWGIFANVDAYAIYASVFLIAFHVVSVFPLSTATFFAAFLAGQGSGLQRTMIIMDVVGLLFSFLLLAVGIHQTLFNNQNGIGVLVFFDALVTMTLSFKRLCVDPLENHDLASRPCYIEKEELPTGGGDVTESNDVSDSSGGVADATAAGENKKELEIV